MDHADQVAVVDDPGGDRPKRPSMPPAAMGFASGTVIGRYVVVRPLGRGGMGAVMLAFDTQLERSVALKVMLTQVESEEARIRFVREAQAMARLSHPNVVGIYDVGVHEGNVFLAMEYVDGVLLSSWLKEKHSIREVLAVMKQAGEGLRAAHEAEVVHRDFKPSNVLIARDGRVCVFDFGIARTEGVEEPTVARLSAKSGQRPVALAAESSDSSRRLTEQGSMIGTVGYASPEQTLGEATDARSDVFSFTVTLWFALYGERPFDSSSVANYILAVNANERPRRPARTKVPLWLHAVLERGLGREPRARFASMKELLEALEVDPTRRRRRIAAAGLVVVAGALVMLGFARHRAGLALTCRAEGDAAPDAWAAKRAAVATALRSETDSFATERTDRTLSRLDDFVASWRSVAVESCESSRIAKTQSEEVYDRRSECLRERQMQLDVVADVLSAGDSKTHRQSLAMASRLDSPTQCTDAATSRSPSPLPRDPVARAKSLEARRDLLRSDYPGAMGFDGARALAEQARDLAHVANDPHTEAIAEFRLGRLSEKRYQHRDALRAYWHVCEAAEALGDDSLAAAAAIEAAFILGDRLERRDDARAWLDVARAKIARLGGSEPLEIDVLRVASTVETDLHEALDLNARAIALATKAYGDTSMVLCLQRRNRGSLYHLLGEPDNAADAYKSAIDCQIRATASSGDDELIFDYSDLSDAQRASGRWQDAVASARSATDVLAARDPDAGLLAVSRALESMALVGKGDAPEAVRLAESAVGVATRHSSEHRLFPAILALGLARAAAHDVKGAQEACARAVAIDDADNPPSPDKTYDDDALRCVGEAELALGDVRHAREHLERSAALHRRAQPGALALSRFALARALVVPPIRKRGAWATDEPRAVGLAMQARDELRAVVERYRFLEPSLDAVEAWLASRTR